MSGQFTPISGENGTGTYGSRYADKQPKAPETGKPATITDIRVRIRAIAAAAAKAQKQRAKAAQAAKEDEARAIEEGTRPAIQVSPMRTRYQDKRAPKEASVAVMGALDPEETAQEASLFQKFHSLSKTKQRIMLAAAAGCLAGYLAVAAHFDSHFYPRTSAYGVDVSGMNGEAAAEAIRAQAASYHLTVRERGGSSEQLSASQIGLAYQEDGSIAQALRAQKSLLWPFVLAFGRAHSVPVAMTYDKAGIADVIRSLSCFREEEIVRPENARLGETTEGYEIVPEVMGNLPDDAQTIREIVEALDAGASSVNLELSGCYVEPEIYADDPALIEDMEARNALFGANLTISFGDREELVDADVIRTFLNQRADGSYFIDPDGVHAYAQSLAQQYDTLGGYRVFHTSTDRDVELWGGDYGWEMDIFSTAQGLLEAIRAKMTGSFTPVYTHTALCRDANDIGGTYVEVSITDQEMWVYQDGTLMVDTPVVTGNPNKDNATPSGGVWEIDGKYRDETLVGEGYRQPVDYWIPFNGGVGIHDLKSRYYYGGTIYLTNGSHGCVNTPLDAVAQIYDIVYAGVPVVVYE